MTSNHRDGWRTHLLRIDREGDTIGYQAIADFGDFSKLIGFQKVWDFDEKYAPIKSD